MKIEYCRNPDCGREVKRYGYCFACWNELPIDIQKTAYRDSVTGGKQGFWLDEEIDEHVLYALTALNAEWFTYLVPPFKIRLHEAAFIKAMGTYFPPSDRICLMSELDIRNDGIPTTAVNSFIRDGSETWQENEYLRSIYIMPIKKPPRGVIPKISGKHYVGINTNALEYGEKRKKRQNRAFVEVTKFFFSVDPDKDLIVPCRDARLTTWFRYDYKHDWEHPVVRAASTISIWADRRYLWNVEAMEPSSLKTSLKMKAIFGVYGEQIKSLFYARDLPMTRTGRKSPILHWVSAHKRRIKEGIDIDIKKHLRGTSALRLRDTVFQIIAPRKRDELFLRDEERLVEQIFGLRREG